MTDKNIYGLPQKESLNALQDQDLNLHLLRAEVIRNRNWRISFPQKPLNNIAKMEDVRGNISLIPRSVFRGLLQKLYKKMQSTKHQDNTQ